MTGKLHSRVWMLWLAAVLTIVALTHNPLYLTLLWLCIAVVNIVTREEDNTVWNSLWTLWASLAILPMSAIFNALTTHFGRVVLFTIPGNIPLISGIVTLEALVYGLTNGLVLSVVINAFWTFNRNVPAQILLRLIPRVYYSLAVVASIAVTFIPFMLNQFQQIREAQSIRGHRFRGIRDFLPLLMPLLMGSLERAFQLAETMTARGFHQPLSFSLMTTANKLFFLIGIVLFFLGWQAHVFFPQGMLHSGLANGLLLGGGIFFVLPFWRAGRVQGHTRYQVETWRKVDGWLMLVLGLAVFGFWLMARGGTAGLDYSPYPTLSLPEFTNSAAIFILSLCLPAFLQHQKDND